MKNRITALKNLLEGYNIRPQSQKKERISEPEDSSFEIIKSEEGKKMRKSRDLRDLSRGPICRMWELQKRKRAKSLHEEITAQTSQI